MYGQEHWLVLRLRSTVILGWVLPRRLLLLPAAIERGGRFQRCRL
jgi:hypothetical protein